MGPQRLLVSEFWLTCNAANRSSMALTERRIMVHALNPTRGANMNVAQAGGGLTRGVAPAQANTAGGIKGQVVAMVKDAVSTGMNAALQTAQGRQGAGQDLRAVTMPGSAGAQSTQRPGLPQPVAQGGQPSAGAGLSPSAQAQVMNEIMLGSHEGLQQVLELALQLGMQMGAQSAQGQMGAQGRPPNAGAGLPPQAQAQIVNELMQGAHVGLQQGLEQAFAVGASGASQNSALAQLRAA